MKKQPKILVVGSMVMDLIVSTEHFPAAGETVIGCGFSTAPGGKGANQALAAARLGAKVAMVGRVGNDDFGRQIKQSLENGGVDISGIKTDDDAPTAIGNVQLEVSESGTENRIIVVPGANMRITPDDILFLRDTIGEYDMVMLQHEIPAEINLLAAQYAKNAGVPVMLNPAPAAHISDELLSCLAYLSPNEHEAAEITGINPEGDAAVSDAANALRSMGVGAALITLGKNGCAFCDESGMQYSRSVDCGRVIDPTAAGDSFVAAFCRAVSSGCTPADAMLFANCTAGITVTRMGAQTSLPELSEVKSVIDKNSIKIDGIF